MRKEIFLCHIRSAEIISPSEKPGFENIQAGYIPTMRYAPIRQLRVVRLSRLELTDEEVSSLEEALQEGYFLSTKENDEVYP